MEELQPWSTHRLRSLAEKQHVCVNLSKKICGLTNRNDDLANKHGYFSWLFAISYYIYSIYIYLYLDLPHSQIFRTFCFVSLFSAKRPKNCQTRQKRAEGAEVV